MKRNNEITEHSPWCIPRIADAMLAGRLPLREGGRAF